MFDFVPMQMYRGGKGRHACKMFRQHFSITVQRNPMRFGGIVAPSSGCLSLTLGPCSSFSFEVVSVLLSRFDSLFKCTVNKKLQTLTTPCSNVLCN